MLILPATNDPRQTMTVNLDGQNVDVSLWWQPLSSAWYVSVDTRAGVAITRGRQIASGVRLIRSAAFAGELVAVPAALEGADDLGERPWGSSHQLAWLSPSEVGSLKWTV